ncbi:MAG TPA: PQQ-binding-like beta-propeller repeat protein, partial [Thermoguttaceae bacterium]|nr:PQQ-binding-like beta-propeller repeat protein [Thermoguttaceae bacterium]
LGWVGISSAADWPQFHGPSRDAKSTETGLLQEWPEKGPTLLWKMEGLGEGYSTVSIVDGKVFTMGDLGEEDDRSQFVIAFDLATRQKLWATRVGEPHRDGSRCTPTVDGGLVYAIGTSGDLVCVRADTGELVWKKNFEADFGGKMMSGWRYSESPLVDGDQVVCTPGGQEAIVVALNKKTGETIWKTPMQDIGDEGKDGAGYSSIVAAEIDGVRQYVQIVGRGAISVDAATGKFLWGYNRVANKVANITKPIVRGNHVFVTSSYKTGSALLNVTLVDGKFNVEEVYWLTPKEFENHHGGVVLVGDKLYGGDGQNTGTPVCLDFLTGEIEWKAEAPSKGSAAVIYADGFLVFRYDLGNIVLIEATPEEFRIKGRFKQTDRSRRPAWAHPIILDGKMYFRDGDLLLCYDIEAK